MRRLIQMQLWMFVKMDHSLANTMSWNKIHFKWNCSPIWISCRQKALLSLILVQNRKRQLDSQYALLLFCHKQFVIRRYEKKSGRGNKMTKTIAKAPFRADHVGSLLRPESIHKARKDFREGSITAEKLHEIETEEIKKVVDKQIEVGLEAVTDGEIRRRFWHTDFLEHLNGVEGYVPERGFQFNGEETERYDVQVNGKISFNPDHPHVKDFIKFKEIVGDRAVAKQTIPSPNQLFNAGIRNLDIYPDIEAYANDIIQAYRDALKTFYNAGCRYLQMDDVYIAGLNAPDRKS